MKYFIIEPEVAGELGEETELDTSKHPPVVKKLDYKFSGWLGDALITTFPCFAVTEAVANVISANGFTGVKFAGMQSTVSEEFGEMHPNLKLPKFVWMQITGERGFDDFGLSNDFRLVVSEKAQKVLQTAGIKNAITSDFDSLHKP
jgi:hypothetical protein